MKKKKVFLIILFVLVVGLVCLYIFNNKNIFDKDMDLLENKENSDNTTNNLFKTCIVLKMSNNSQIECQDNVIYNVELSDDYKVGDILKIEYQDEFIEDNFVNLSKISSKNYNYLNEENGVFKDYYKKALEKLNRMSLDEKIGQILLARVSDVNQIKDLKTYKFGGYLLFKRDFQNKTKDEVIKMINEYQENSNIPLLIAADEEGGIVSRISSNKNLVSEPFKSPRVLYKEGGLDRIKEDTINKNKILANLGINLNLAPVVDVSTSETDYMYKRSLGEDANITSEFAKVVVDASRKNLVSYCLKHFPGYGNNIDTHKEEAIDKRNKDEILNKDLLPFKEGIKAGAKMIMVSHNIVSSIDNNNPASLSYNIHSILRKDLNYQNLIITDDLSMKALDEIENKCEKAILAGNDLIITKEPKECINEIINSKQIKKEVLDNIVLRILLYKFENNLIIAD